MGNEGRSGEAVGSVLSKSGGRWVRFAGPGQRAARDRRLAFASRRARAAAWRRSRRFRGAAGAGHGVGIDGAIVAGRLDGDEAAATGSGAGVDGRAAVGAGAGAAGDGAAVSDGQPSDDRGAGFGGFAPWRHSSSAIAQRRRRLQAAS